MKKINNLVIKQLGLNFKRKVMQNERKECEFFFDNAEKLKVNAKQFIKLETTKKC